MDAVYSEVQKESLDFTKPLYLAAALYTACKLVQNNDISITAINVINVIYC